MGDCPGRGGRRAPAWRREPPAERAAGCGAEKMATASLLPVSDFPPRDLRSFLQFCAGEWLSVRSSFDLEEPLPEPSAGQGAAPEEAPSEEGWHAALRGELAVLYLEPEQDGAPGGLRVTPPAAAGGPEAGRELHFEAGGTFACQLPAGEPLGRGSWRFWPDGSLELSQSDGAVLLHERIWFTKPNLRLRSSVEQRPDGRPARASFSSEIRRVSRAVAPGAASEGAASPAGGGSAGGG